MSSEKVPQETNMRSPIPLTLVVACSPNNGIGKNGSLPWRLRKEMAYFKSVTTDTSSLTTSQVKAKNVVIMGRNTWESIPKKFRPLPDRQNLVISRTATADALGIEASKDSHLSNSLSDAASHLYTTALATNGANVFLIGGAQLYNLFLQNRQQQGFELQRLLITRIKQPMFPDCDTFLDEFRSHQQVEADAAGQSATSPLEEPRWKKALHSELLEFLGRAASEEVKQSASQKEGDVEYELQMWFALA